MSRLISFDDETGMRPEESCLTCRYFLDGRHCHRYPPSCDWSKEGWLDTKPNWWCGEWQDVERTYTPNERQLDCLIDCQIAPG